MLHIYNNNCCYQIKLLVILGINKLNLYIIFDYFYCFIVMSIEPTIDSKSIIDVNNIKRGKFV